MLLTNKEYSKFRQTELFKPCIDIHEGKVKQIVGATLHSQDQAKLTENFVSKQDLKYYIDEYKKFGLQDGHIIMLDQSEATRKATAATLTYHKDIYHVGGGVNLSNASGWLNIGAKKVIVSSALFQESKFKISKLQELSSAIGKDRLVIDLSAVIQPDGYYASIHGWKTITDFKLIEPQLKLAGQYASEFLIHAIDREGKKGGADFNLISLLHEYSLIPVVYAGGIASLSEVEKFLQVTRGEMGFTIGSSLDLFGGNISLEELLNFLKNYSS